MRFVSHLPFIAMMALPLVGGALGYYDKDTAMMLTAAMAVGLILVKFLGFAFKAGAVALLGLGALLLATGTPPTAIINEAVAFGKRTAEQYLWSNTPSVEDVTEVARSRVTDELQKRGIHELNDIGNLRIGADGKLTATPSDDFYRN
ncbi:MULTISPECIES: hypothetical protein [unclassified Pannonibacter]|uniref:hypothetical protein n=1 Tax=unclassified Pannonibacter TaxID=2627228 RepID=UPI0016468136|nr:MULTISPECIES: hypothetical protein [unclassified Pannonibacter]